MGNNLTDHFRINQNVTDTILFADHQGIIAETEDIQLALYKLNIFCKDYSLKISSLKRKFLKFKEVRII
jgi:hypothetical protein